MAAMKPMPHVHAYVLDKDGNPISKCIDSDRHPSLTARGLEAAKAFFRRRGLFLFHGRPARAVLPARRPAQ